MKNICINRNCLKLITFVFLIPVFIRTFTFNNNLKSEKYSKSKSQKKYILLWTSTEEEPFKSMGFGRKVFMERKCTYTNCFIAPSSYYYTDYGKFHAVIFSMKEATNYPSYKLPKHKHPYQKFVFSSIESSHYYPACSDRFNGYFNWTWSFRLDSDCRWEYIAIRDKNKNVIGPNNVMHWIKLEDMNPMNSTFEKSLRSKNKAAAWFASNCNTKSLREKYVGKLRDELAVYNLTIDIYGNCGNLTCRKSNKKCMDMIKLYYYFYLSFENSFSQDYVTEKLLHALQNNAVPIVYGSANYTRFMPDGTYINAMKMSPKKLAKKMNKLIKKRKKYMNYFRWKNHYSYHSRSDSAETDDFCAFCKLLNDEKMFKVNSVVENFRKWWDSPDFCQKKVKRYWNKTT